MKKSFVLYTDMWETADMLSDEALGQMMKAVFHYQALGELPQDLSPPAAVLFAIIRKQLDRDNEKYQRVCRSRSEAGKKGAYVTNSRFSAANEATPTLHTPVPESDSLMLYREQIRKNMGISES